MQLHLLRCHHLLNCLIDWSHCLSDRRLDFQRCRAVRVACQLASHCLPDALAWALLQLCLGWIAVCHGLHSTETIARVGSANGADLGVFCTGMMPLPQNT